MLALLLVLQPWLVVLRPQPSHAAAGHGGAGCHSSPPLLSQVLFCEDSIAIVEGLNNDADVGTALSFASGASGWVVAAGGGLR